MDTACARVAVSHHATPARIEDCRKTIAALEIELEILENEVTMGIDSDHPLDEAREEIEKHRAELSELEEAWEKEKHLVEKIASLRRGLLSEDEAHQRDEHIESIRAAESELNELQNNHPLIHPTVDSSVVASVVSDWTGIPLGRMVENEIEAVLNLPDRLEERIVGQRHALETISERIQISRAGLEDPNKPVGVFLLTGSSGVGKTETALALAEALYGGEENLITLNMSEFQEAHTVSTLKGAPPGYVGYGEGGVLTEAVRRKPYSVVLLDEVEKAHPDVHEIFYQVFDKGAMEDGEGRKINFKNTVIILTTNAGTNEIMDLSKEGQERPELEDMNSTIRLPLLDVFPPALLGRMTVIPYYPLDDEILRLIIGLKLEKIRLRLQANRGIELTFGEDLVSLILERCGEVESGGRIVDSILNNTLVRKLSAYLLLSNKEQQRLEKTVVTVNGQEIEIENS